MSKTHGLTAMQRRCYDYLFERIMKTGVGPTHDEVAQALGLKSKSNAHRLLSALTERGLIRRPYGRARAIELCEPGDPLRELLRRRLFVLETNCPDLAAEIKPLL